jgi:hypothetical protein
MGKAKRRKKRRERKGKEIAGSLSPDLYVMGRLAQKMNKPAELDVIDRWLKPLMHSIEEAERAKAKREEDPSWNPQGEWLTAMTKLIGLISTPSATSNWFFDQMNTRNPEEAAPLAPGDRIPIVMAVPNYLGTMAFASDYTRQEKVKNMEPIGKWYYVVGDGRSPGAYEEIDGYCLQSEGSGKIEEGEVPESGAVAFSEALGPDEDGRYPEIAVVDFDGEEPEVIGVFRVEKI